MKRLLALTLCVLLLAGCTAPVVETTTPPEPEYIGSSPVPNLRTGIMAQGTTALCNGIEVTNQGVYFFAQMDMGQYLMYIDHNGTEAVKLCSRPDCAHDSNTCNAFSPPPPMSVPITDTCTLKQASELLWRSRGWIWTEITAPWY